MSKLTDWYSYKVKPVRSGVYEVMGGGRHRSYAYFDAEHKYWGPYEPSVWHAHLMRYYVSTNQNKTWRGLANPPAEAETK